MTLDSGDPSRFRIAEEMLRSSPVSSALPKRTVRRIGITRMRTRLRRSRRSCRNSFLATWPITASIPVTPSRHQASCRSRLVVSIATRLLKNPFRSGCSKWSGCKAVCRRPGYPAQLGPGVLEVRRSECRGKRGTCRRLGHRRWAFFSSLQTPSRELSIACPGRWSAPDTTPYTGGNGEVSTHGFENGARTAVATGRRPQCVGTIR